VLWRPSYLGIFLVTACLWLGWPSQAPAQQAKGHWGGWGPGSRHAAACSPQTQETVVGTVAAVERFSSGKGMSTGVRLSLQTETETLPVILGPAWYVDAQPLKLAAGDRLTITGCRSIAGGPLVFIANQVKKGDQILPLRQADGRPLWAGQQWRGRR